MMLHSLLKFASFSLLFVLIPGTDFFLVLRATLSSKRTAGLCTALGAALGAMTWPIIIGIGASNILFNHPIIIKILTTLGGIYIIYLGVMEIYRIRKIKTQTTLTTHGPPVTNKTAFGNGYITAACNAQVIAFFLLVAPKFFYPGCNTTIMCLLMGIIDSTLALIWFSLVAFLAHILANLISRKPGLIIRINTVIGVILIIIGIAILFSL